MFDFPKVFLKHKFDFLKLKFIFKTNHAKQSDREGPVILEFGE